MRIDASVAYCTSTFRRPQGWTALGIAAFYGNSAIVEFLLGDVRVCAEVRVTVRRALLLT